MYVLLFVVFKHLLLRETDVLITCRKSKFLRNKNLKKCTSFEAEKGIFGKTFIFWHYYLQLSFVCKTVSQILFKLFCSEDKRLLSQFLMKWNLFQDIMNVSPDIFKKSLKFQKIKTNFCRWERTDNNDINIFLSLENPCTFLLRKEKMWKHIFNTNNESSESRAEKQIMPFKTTVNCQFNNI